MWVETNINITREKRIRLLISEVSIRLKRFADLLVISTLFTSVAAASVLSFSMMLFLNTIMIDMLVCTALITYSIYTLNRLTDLQEDSSNLPERITYLHDNKMMILVSAGLAYAIALIIGFNKNAYLLPILLMPLVIGTIYSVKLSSFRIKDMFAMKNLSVSFSFAFSASVIPFVFYHDIVMTTLLFSLLFIKIFVNTIIFDTRDKIGDARSGSRTIPLMLGTKKTKSILLVMNSLLFVWLIVCYATGVFIIYLPVILFSILYTYACIWLFFKKERPHNIYNYDFFIDGEYLILSVLAIAMHGFFG